MFKLSKYRIVQENGYFYPESKVFYLFWSRYIYTFSSDEVRFDSLDKAENYLRKVTSKPEDNRTIHEFKL